MYDFDKQLSALGRQSVLCIGDLMLDYFIYGEVTRISPEAPTPVIAVQREEFMIGAAGNVARNIASLGARCVFIGVVGNDHSGIVLKRELAKHKPKVQSHIVIDPSRPTTRKIRYVSEHFSTHMLRADWEEVAPVSPQIETKLIRAALKAMPKVGAVVLSDYAKGVLTPRVVRTIIKRAIKLKKPIVVDPKGTDYSNYRGATIITPNRKELREATRSRVGTLGQVATAADELVNELRLKAMLVTLSEDGMLLQMRGKAPVHVPANPVKVRDVSGAGDTVVATLATLLALGADFESAMRASNAAASVVVGKRGGATVSAQELRETLVPAATRAAEQKIVSDPRELQERLAAWRAQDLRVGFTNGVFDLLHPGHVKVLSQARSTCDRLVVGLNSDASVRRLKGKERPIQGEQARAEVLAGLEAVDLVVVFGQDTPLELIRKVRPNVLVKGGDYRRNQVVGGDLVEQQGGEVVLIELVPGFSTTRIVARSRGRVSRRR